MQYHLALIVIDSEHSCKKSDGFSSNALIPHTGKYYQCSPSSAPPPPPHSPKQTASQDRIS